MTVKASRGAKGRADRLFSQLVRARGDCERCGNPASQTAHIIGRRFAKVRTDERNAWALCGSCHFLVDNFVEEKHALIARTIGWNVYSELRVKAEATKVKVDWDAECVRLKALLEVAA